MLSQQMLLLGSYDGLGLLPQLPVPSTTSSLPLAARMASGLPASQLDCVNAYFLGRPGLGLGGNMLPAPMDALSLGRQHLALLQRQRQAQLMRMLAGPPVQHTSTFPRASLASIGQGSQSIMEALMAHHASQLQPLRRHDGLGCKSLQCTTVYNAMIMQTT